MTINSMSATNRYGALAAEIYDLDKPVGALPDSRFYVDRLKKCEGPILEPACGSGRAIVPLLEAGLEVVGFDRSPEMLERCRERCRRKNLDAKLDQQTMEDFRDQGPFGAIILPVGSFTLVDDLDAARAVLKRFRQALKPGGLILMDLPSLRYLADTTADRRQWNADNGDLLTLDGQRTKTDWLRQRAVSTFRYDRWRDGRLVESSMELMVQRFWGVNELRQVLESIGFGNINVAGGYDGTRKATSADLVFTVEATLL